MMSATRKRLVTCLKCKQRRKSGPTETALCCVCITNDDARKKIRTRSANGHEIFLEVVGRDDEVESITEEQEVQLFEEHEERIEWNERVEESDNVLNNKMQQDDESIESCVSGALDAVDMERDVYATIVTEWRVMLLEVGSRTSRTCIWWWFLKSRSLARVEEECVAILRVLEKP